MNTQGVQIAKDTRETKAQIAYVLAYKSSGAQKLQHDITRLQAQRDQHLLANQKEADEMMERTQKIQDMFKGKIVSTFGGAFYQRPTQRQRHNSFFSTTKCVPRWMKQSTTPSRLSIQK